MLVILHFFLFSLSFSTRAFFVEFKDGKKTFLFQSMSDVPFSECIAKRMKRDKREQKWQHQRFFSSFFFCSCSSGDEHSIAAVAAANRFIISMRVNSFRSIGECIRFRAAIMNVYVSPSGIYWLRFHKSTLLWKPKRTHTYWKCCKVELYILFLFFGFQKKKRW